MKKNRNVREVKKIERHAKSVRKKRRVAPLVPVSDAMKAFSAALAREMENWPEISTGAMFGFKSFYRGKAVFAALPVTKAWKTPNSLMFKLSSPGPRLLARLKADPRIDPSDSSKWFPFEVNKESDLSAALKWLALAYERAKNK